MVKVRGGKPSGILSVIYGRLEGSASRKDTGCGICVSSHNLIIIFKRERRGFEILSFTKQFVKEIDSFINNLQELKRDEPNGFARR